MNEKLSKLGGKQAWLVWSLCVVFVIWLFNLQTGYSVLSPKIQDDLLLTIAQVSLVSSIYTWAFAIVQFISGPMLDRFGLRKCMPWAVALVAVGAFLYSTATGISSLIFAQLFLAFGAAFGFVGAGFAGGKWFAPALYGLMFGWVQSLASIGSAVGTPTISFFANTYDWRNVLFAFFVFGVVLIVAFIAWVKDPVTDRPRPKPTTSLPAEIFSDLAACFSKLNVSLSALIAGVSFGLMLAIGTFWGPRIIEAHGYTSGVEATALLWLGLAVGAPLFNTISNKIGKRKLPFTVGILLQLAMIALIIFVDNIGEPTLLVLMFLLGLTAGTHMLGFTISGESVSGALVGSASAIVNATCFIIGGIAMSLPAHLLPTGVTPTLGDFQSALLMMPIILVIAFLLSFLVKETYVRPRTPLEKIHFD